MCGMLKLPPGRGSLTAVLILAVLSLALFVLVGMSSGCHVGNAAAGPRHTLSVPDRSGTTFRIWPPYRVKTASPVRR